MNTQTPITDAEQKWTFGDNRPGMSFECVKVEFAQELEKELSSIRRERDSYKLQASRALDEAHEARQQRDDAERRFQYQKEENDNRIKQIRKLQQELAKHMGMPESQLDALRKRLATRIKRFQAKKTQALKEVSHA